LTRGDAFAHARRVTPLRLATLVALACGLALAAPSVRADDVEIDLDLKALAQCIDASGAVFYGAHWCPYCRKQMEAFGKYARYLPYVECYDGPRNEGMNRTCRRADVESFPTWHYPDGRVVTGQKEPITLAIETGCLASAKK